PSSSPCPRHPHDPPPFPTRRSSDLQFPGLPSTGAIDATASQRVSGLLFPATRKGDIMESLARQAVNQRRSALTGARNSATDAVKDRKSTRLNSSHQIISYAVFCLKK